ncbi:alpha/beta fold hydrolase [Halodesulfovibrio sp.]|jgi:pimeloyl-ACP methyl ester carboxylesterase|uniref:alpha/beta fold hydrolase n=1 Tax=Halodesulfovibrio sp. TaxID=1912772 RepID=UPI0025FE283E|nr:alpha/beta fold hydrolase [Halodesulfovibrio sp.]MCT4536452.1 alpha/beta fold hydrolase [Halodesulfovibrio sp.]
MRKSKSFILIHGAWHDHHSWDFIVPLLEEVGHYATGIDLPGAGELAQSPVSYFENPVELDAFAVQVSPNAFVTQEERNKAVIDLVRECYAEEDKKVILVGHSLGGITVSAVAEMVPNMVLAVIYLSALLLPPQVSAFQMLSRKSMSRRMTPQLYVGDGAKTGAMRINPKSTDPSYLDLVKQTFYGDLSDEEFRFALSTLFPDEPIQVATVPSPITQKRFGRIPRHYIHCCNDRAYPLSGQRDMVRLVDEAMGNKTVVHMLESSHSPFFSQPKALAKILDEIAQS